MQSSYAACHNGTETPIDTDNSGVMYLNSSVHNSMIPDGLANTIVFGEKITSKRELGWGSGTRATIRNTGAPLNSLHEDTEPYDPCYVGGFGSAHSGFVNFGFADGSVRPLTDSIDSAVLQSFGSRYDRSHMVSEF